MTAYIPTPLDISTRPGVVGANLFLAVVMMLPFAIAAELFTRTLGQGEAGLRRRLQASARLNGLLTRLEQSFSGRRPALPGALKLLGVMCFYGLVFSLLDRAWNPFSLRGIVLFASMTVAYGVIGIADDLFQYRAVRKWGLPAELKVRPANFLLAALSTLASRLFTLIPGLMFGTPEALCLDEDALDERQQRSLMKISARTFITIGLAVWLPTILTSRLPLLIPEGAALTVIGGVEAFLLVLFAVALENTFVQMLGFPGGFGQALKQWNRWAWLAGLVLVTFAFLHTLLNPRGELVQALQQGNVLVFLAASGSFVVISLGLHLYSRRKSAAAPPPAAPGLPQATPGLPQATPGLPQAMPGLPQATPGLPQAMPGLAAPPPTLAAIPPNPSVYAALDGDKTCPVCCAQIKARARLCRFCRATFTVSLRGYCLAEHVIAAASTDERCAGCGGELVDLHVESRLLQPPAMPAPRLALAVEAEASSPAAAPGARICPHCGQAIKAEARLCRFCRTPLG